MNKDDLIKKLENINFSEIEIPSHKRQLKMALLNFGFFKKQTIMSLINISLIRKFAPVGAIAIVVIALLVVLGGNIAPLPSLPAMPQPPPSLPLITPLGLDLLIFKPEHTEAFEKLVNSKSDLIARGVPIVGFDKREREVDFDTGVIKTITIQVGLREVKDEYKELIKAIVEGVEGIEFDFFQARFTYQEMLYWGEKIVDTFWANIDGEYQEIIDVNLFRVSLNWRDQKIQVYIYGEKKPEYIEAIRQVVGDEAPLEFKNVPERIYKKPYAGDDEGGNYWWQDLPSDYFTPYEQRLFKEIVVLIMDRYFGIDVSRMTSEEMYEVSRLIGTEGQEKFYRLFKEYAQQKGLEIPRY